MRNWLNQRFQLKALGTSVRTEVLAGVTTFLTMAYIIIVNPLILADAGIPLSAALFATVVVAALSSILMGLVANLPIALAPGMGLNAFFTYTLVLGLGMTWQTGLAAVFLSGVVFLIISLPQLNLREKIAAAVPPGIRAGVAAGIGLFLALIGLKNAGVVVENPATLVAFGGTSPVFWLFLIGLVVAAILLTLRVKGALIISVLGVSLLAALVPVFTAATGAVMPTAVLELPSMAAFLALDFTGLFTVSVLAPVFALLFTDLFDSISTFMGVSKAAGLVDENGEPKNIGKALLVDAISTTASGLAGTSPGTAYIESAAGVAEGGRSGLTAVVTGLLFLPFLFVAPLLTLVPSVATAPVLVLVGLFMITALKDVDWADYGSSIPAFIALVMIPFTYSITLGIVFAFITYTAMRLLTGRRVGLVLLVITALSVVMLLVS